MNDFYVSELQTGYPKIELSEKAKTCFDTLEKLNIKYKYVFYNKEPQLDSEKELVDKILGVKPIKNLVFSTHNRSHIFYFIVFRDQRFDHHSFRDKYNISKIHMINDQELKDLLNTKSGSVSVTELVNDKDLKLEVYIDPLVLKEQYIRFHPNENIGTVIISMDDFINKLMPYTNHKLNII